MTEFIIVFKNFIYKLERLIKMTDKIKELAKKYSAEIMAAREYFHANPGIEFQEFETTKKIIETLEKYGIEYEKDIAVTGILAIVRGKKDGKTVLLRGDMDALPIEEEADVPYKSTVKGVMHACGHDSHAAGLLGAALILNDLKDEISGNIKFAFQPAEENQGGAEPMIKAGILENPKVDAAFGLHVWGPYPEGKAITMKGPMMAAPDNIRIKLIGKGGHASMPNELIDPVVMAAEVILSLQTIVSRKINPLDPVVISCSTIHGGSAQNVIPNEVEITGTVRTLNEEVRKKMPTLMEQTIKGITDIYNGSYEFDYHWGYPCLVNDGKSTEILMSSAEKILGAENVGTMKQPTMGGEDFSYFSQKVPSSFIFLGVAKDMSNPPVHHHPKFAFDSKNTVVSSEILAQVAVDFLGE